MLIGKFPQKVDRSGIARFFPVKSFSKKDSTFNYFFKKIQNKGKGLQMNEEHYCRKGFNV